MQHLIESVGVTAAFALGIFSLMVWMVKHMMTRHDADRERWHGLAEKYFDKVTTGHNQLTMDHQAIIKAVDKLVDKINGGPK